MKMTIALAILVLGCVAKWQLFEKAGEAGWKSLIPYYGKYVYCKLAHCVGLFIAELILGVFLQIAIFAFFIESIVLTYLGIASSVFEWDSLWNHILSVLGGGALSGILIVAAAAAVLGAILLINITINIKFVRRYSDESIFQLLAGIGSIPAFDLMLVITYCILAFDKKYLYRG